MRLSSRLLLVLTVTLASGTVVSAQQSIEQSTHARPASRIFAADLKADLAVLREAFETVHPGLYRSNTREQMATNWSVLEEAWSKDVSRSEAFLALSIFAAKVRCGHTYVNPHNQSDDVVQELCAGRNRVPFCFRWISRRMIVTRDQTGHGAVAAGTEILSINGTPVGEILDRLLTIARADGSNDAKRMQLLEVSGLEKFETFDLFFPLLFPVSGSSFELRVQAPGGGEATRLTVDAITHEERVAQINTSRREPEGENEPLWKLPPVEDGIALFPMPSWVAYRTKWDWEGFINRTFDTLIEQNVPALVIDLRGNEGGSSVGDVLLARLIEQPVPRSVRQRFVRYRTIPPALNPILDTWDPQFRDWGSEAIGPIDLADRKTGLAPGTTSGFYRLRNEDGSDPDQTDQMIEPRGPIYRGRVFILIDASNSSATFEFASRIKTLGLGTLIGQPSGGNQRGINGGAFFFVRLPKSGLEIDLPIMAQFLKDRTTLAPDAGITPDVLVTPTPADIQSGIDPEMREVRRLLETAK